MEFKEFNEKLENGSLKMECVNDFDCANWAMYKKTGDEKVRVDCHVQDHNEMDCGLINLEGKSVAKLLFYIYKQHEENRRLGAVIMKKRIAINELEAKIVKLV